VVLLDGSHNHGFALSRHDLRSWKLRTPQGLQTEREDLDLARGFDTLRGGLGSLVDPALITPRPTAKPLKSTTCLKCKSLFSYCSGTWVCPRRGRPD
jgi:hypothetical protein